MAENQSDSDKEDVGSSTVTPLSPGKRQRKTKSTACRRCHARKVKCSGGQPCENCRQASKGAECSYPRKNRLVKVSQQYIDDLIAENQRLRQDDAKPRPEPSIPDVSSTETSSLQGTLLEERPWFFDMNVLHTPVLIGEASDAAFATRFRQAISEPGHSHIPRVNYAPDERLLALSDQDCPWPIPSRARLLVNVALKYVSRTYYIVRKSQILEGLEQTIVNPHSADSLLRSKLWVLFAIGEMYSTRTAAKDRNFPGMAYFARATRILRIISERPRIDAIEIRLLLSFYSLALNRRYTAYALAGSSVRLSVVMGLHLNVPESQLRDAGAREHRNRVWWTAYSFDRMWASRLGHPVTIQDDDIEVDLPTDPVLDTPSDDFADSSYFIAGLRLARLAAKVINAIYTRRPQQKTLSQRVQEALRDLRAFVEELPPHLHIEPTDAPEPSPKPLSLHLYFNQVAITATRPILLHVLRTHVSAWDTQPRTEPQIPVSAMTLSEACIRCARHSCRLLIDCWIDGSFATFDYFYTQYLFSSATVLAISSLIDGKECRSDKEQFESAAQFLHQLKENGNFAAEEFCRHVDAMKLVHPVLAVPFSWQLPTEQDCERQWKSQKTTVVPTGNGIVSYHCQILFLSSIPINSFLLLLIQTINLNSYPKPTLTIISLTTDNMSSLSTAYPTDGEVIDIGGSSINLTFVDDQLPKAFLGKGDFPKEIAYTSGMEKWNKIADNSYQTSDEMTIIKATAQQVVEQLPSGTHIIDLGAANSKKFEPYVHEFIAQGKECVYVALDLSHASLVEHIAKAKATFPGVKCIGLYGSFEQGDVYFKQTRPVARLFLSLGSIFYNAPDYMAKDRCIEFKGHMTPVDRLIVGQDGPTGAEASQTHAAYNTVEYDAFFTTYLQGLQDHAGIVGADPKTAWTVESKLNKAMHYFDVTATHDMYCIIFGIKVAAGTTFKMFKSWKRYEGEIHKLTNEVGLKIETLGKADNSGMRQYLIKAAEN
ncbi:positive activator of transcription [Fusarium napiforme]|uniref:Positive activator of transcription n=1 Tax=Fusarium napiforme TaxID=42672 RepID=A0A8H5IAU5_9HYPO|nr:positive activator of transcription [Fusarium napiforme]